MQAGSSSSSHCDAEKKDLEELLEAFGSAFSLEDIASAYCKARNNVDTAGQILCASLGSTSHDATCTSKDKLKCARSTTSELSSELDGASAMPSEMSSDSILQNSHHGGRHTRLLKSKVRPVSMGTVSGIIAKDYAKPRPVTNEYPGSKKPPGLDSKELPISEIWREEVPPNMTAGKGTIHGYVEEFMFKMLGDGFQLDMSVIQEVLGCCGYDVQKSMEKLLELSASTLENRDDVVDLADRKSSEKHREQGSACGDEARIMKKSLTELPKRDKDRFVIQKEILEALFTVPERSEEAPKRVQPVRRFRGFGEVVVERLKDPAIEHAIVTAKPLEVTKDEGGDDSYEVLRQAVKEYWTTTKEYYQAAVDACVKGDYSRANKLREQGHFFNRMAREADEKSAQKLLEASPQDVVSLDLHDQEPKNALRLLRLHLTTFSGIAVLKHLRIIVGNSDEDTKGARRRLILKLLSKESIKWTKDADGRTIMILVDGINPERLSFWKK
ncbi:hypothetical protein I3842_11G169700 [Carya illinoinensis]|uniref:DUF1771 domain-containing protein n=1 Tax=Carya illinoinensis TaxID=32201 RepID=A0A922DR85_CARIL|nr:hypothetical protein I3842_11G169700 [Carya illinoinensis]KAG6689336.1 hypothetical protein I3842_11G169700 [Carya illinoinensis]KAG6689337.1 hypothetical protein I3842_11G169700 [Carya illinoinensis]